MTVAPVARVPRALTIAGSDSGGGAGIQADLKTFAALGVYGASAITALTAQNTLGVTAIHEAPASFVAEQIDAVMADIGADAWKTGMLANAEIVEVVADRAARWEVTNLVVDPVMISKSGHRLLREDAIEAYRRLLIPRALVVTPNTHEAAALVGRPVETWDDVREAARALVEMGARIAVVTGGDRAGPATDLYYDGSGFHEFAAGRVDTTNDHGTGCTFASAIAAALARGEEPKKAVALAKSYVTKALQAAYPVGRGHGPVHHFYRFWRPVAAG
ncbi:MAG TPA: bifunctional hydroxymethylpyrimidine kinase/phosphomethylpyrimidine kinase [Dehalococcoidia bacterium]|nr:bifunctional hydroxymethylpyrimidine kinase/phosphomethylpyrimidine kinase [Dehalococcoidia bacterium]